MRSQAPGAAEGTQAPTGTSRWRPQAWTTDRAVAALTDLTGSGSASHCVHLPGTYPHHQWQGSRLEGFVIAQVGLHAAGAVAQLRASRAAARLQR